MLITTKFPPSRQSVYGPKDNVPSRMNAPKENAWLKHRHVNARVQFDTNVATREQRRPVSYGNSKTLHPNPWRKIKSKEQPQPYYDRGAMVYDIPYHPHKKKVKPSGRPKFEFGNYLDRYYDGEPGLPPVRPKNKITKHRANSVTFRENPTANENRYGALDSGTTSHFMPESFVGTKPGPPPPGGGPIVECANGSTMPATGTDVLNLKDLPANARDCVKLKNLQLPLVSVKQFCRNGMEVAFKGGVVSVYDETGRKVIGGSCGPNREDLYMIPLDDSHPVVNLFDADKRRSRHKAIAKRALSAYEVRAVPALVKFLHACAGFPNKYRWIEAINRNYYSGWPGLTAARDRKYLGKVQYYTYGHQRRTKQGIRSTKKDEEGFLQSNIILFSKRIRFPLNSQTRFPT